MKEDCLNITKIMKRFRHKGISREDTNEMFAYSILNLINKYKAKEITCLLATFHTLVTNDLIDLNKVVK